MATETIYNPLIKKGFQEIADTSSIQADINDLKQKKVTKFFADTDTLEANEIAQYQGPDDAVNGLQNGFFYNTSGQITIQSGTPFIEIPADIVGEFSTIKAGKYYLTDTQAVTQLNYRQATDSNYNDYILFREGSTIDLPVVGDIVCKKAYTYNENSTYYKIASVSWVTGNTYNMTLTNGDALTITLDSAGGYYSYLHEFQNNDGKIFLYQKTATYSNWSPVLLCDTENNNAVIYAPYITAGTTDTEVIISGGFAQVDTQPRIAGISNNSSGGVDIDTDVTISGDLTVSGTSTTVHAQEIQSEADYIEMRNGNPLGLANNERSGLEINNYDGNGTDCVLAVDNAGWARVGDKSGTLQKLATIEETPTAGAFMKYNATDKELESTTDGSPLTVTFTPDTSPVRQNIISADSLSLNFGIISRWFSDFSKYDCVFFTFNYASLIEGLKDLILKGYPFGIIYVESDNTTGTPANGSFIMYYYINVAASNSINLIAKMNGDNFNIYVGNVWRNQSVEPVWKVLLAQNI